MPPETHDPSAGGSPEERRFTVFISYSRRDSGSFAVELMEGLQRLGLTARLDTRDLEYGEKWQAQLREFIRQADAVLIVVSPGAMASRWCRWELALTAAQSKRIVPVVHIAVDPSELPLEISEIHLDPRPFRVGDDGALRGLSDILQRDREWLREHTRLQQLAFTWLTDGRSEDHLLRGQPLQLAESWLERRPPSAAAPSQLHLDFIAAARGLAQKRLRRWIVGLSALTVLAVMLSAVALLQRNRAVREQKRAEMAFISSGNILTELLSTLAQNLDRVTPADADVARVFADKAETLATQFILGNEATEGFTQMKGTALLARSMLRRRLGDLDGALQDATTAVFWARETSEVIPGNIELKILHANSLTELAEIELRRTNRPASESHYNRAIRLLESVASSGSAGVAARETLFRNQLSYGTSLAAAGELHSAIATLDRLATELEPEVRTNTSGTRVLTILADSHLRLFGVHGQLGREDTNVARMVSHGVRARELLEDLDSQGALKSDHARWLKRLQDVFPASPAGAEAPAKKE